MVVYDSILNLFSDVVYNSDKKGGKLFYFHVVKTSKFASYFEVYYMQTDITKIS